MPHRPDQLRDFARRYTDAWCSQEPTRVAAHYAADGRIVVNGAAPAPILEVAESFMAAFPDMAILMDDVFVRDDERIEYHWTLDGTNTGSGGTGNHVRMSGFETWTMGDDGLVASSVGTFDQAEYARQLAEGV
jgi:nuclear transport factor 2 (NTF2) superfamily protein